MANGYADAFGGYADAFGGYADPYGGYMDVYGGYHSPLSSLAYLNYFRTICPGM
jgi:hypothetical protein